MYWLRVGDTARAEHASAAWAGLEVVETAIYVVWDIHARGERSSHTMAGGRTGTRRDTYVYISTERAKLIDRPLAMLYGLTKRLAQILSLPLTLHHTLAPGLQKRKGYDPERHMYDNVPPEVGLVSAAIVVLKMVYGLDGRGR